jgi:hypothetical protein
VVETAALMGRFTVLGLLVLVGALSAVLLMKNRERAAATRSEEALFPGLDAAAANAIDRLEVENLERGTRVTLERDPAGRWAMLVPVPYPAGGVLSGILQALCDTRGTPLTDEADDDAALGLDPPRAVVVWRAGDGDRERRGRLEIGGDSIGDERVFARADGRVLSISRAFYNLVQVPPNEYRERRVSTLSAADVIALKRRGWIAREPGGEMESLELDALLEPGLGWCLQEPRALLDPVLVGFLLRDSAEMRIESFTADDPGDYSPWGLAEPRMTIELEDLAGQTLELWFGTNEVGPIDVESAERWFVRRKGYPHVWGVSRRVVGLLSAPRLELLDTLLVRAAREDVASIELGAARLERDGARWRVFGAGIDAAHGVPADETRVQDVLAALEIARVEEWEPTRPPPAPSIAGLPLALALRAGRRVGGEVFAEPGEPVRFRRFGDELVGTVGASVADLVLTDATALRERRIPFPIEFQMGALELSSGEATARFERDPDTGRWSRAGVAGEADRAFFGVLEALQALAVDDWLAAAAAPGAAERIDVRVTAAPGVDPQALATSHLAFGLAPGGERAVCVLEDGAVVAVRAELVAALRSLLH